MKIGGRPQVSRLLSPEKKLKRSLDAPRTLWSRSSIRRLVSRRRDLFYISLGRLVCTLLLGSVFGMDFDHDHAKH